MRIWKDIEQASDELRGVFSDLIRRLKPLGLSKDQMEALQKELVSANREIVGKLQPYPVEVGSLGNRVSDEELAALVHLRTVMARRAFPDAQEALKELLQFSPEGLNPEILEILRKDDSLDEELIRPWGLLFSESFLYPILGKEDARTVLALLRPLEEALKVDQRVVQGEAYYKMNKKPRKERR